MSRNKISERIQQQVRNRANYLCEFCHANEQWQYVRFTVDHVIPVSLGGSDNSDNLTLACFHCNRRKTNRERVISIRAADLEIGRHPSLDDPIQSNI